MDIRSQTRAAVAELVAIEKAHFNPVKLLVIGCSSSEIAGGTIGHNSTYELGEALANAALDMAEKHGFALAFQCCEHLNRSIVMEEAVLRSRCLMQVNAVPQPKAGGSVPAAAWKRLTRPALAAFIQADAAIDVGDTLVGMHIRPVAVPLRIEYDHIGHANLVMAYSRLPYIGGSRAVYE